jgi:hypothetical protein
MTHFRCAVFSYDPSRFDALLAPYSESDEAYFRFIKSTRTEEQFKADYELNKAYEKEQQAESFPDYETWLKGIGYERVNGVIGYYGNPNATWDWYTLNGGDWQFSLKNEEDYDDGGPYTKNQYAYLDENYSVKETEELYRHLQENAKESDNEYIRQDAQDMLNNFTLEEYMEYQKWKFPYAYITPDGVWHAPGTVGWFAASDDTAASRKKYWQDWMAWIQSDENPYVNFVDCHI